ncbi:hypothetical protein [Bacillus sp. JJ1562]|uniref:hypothetical protein n=1 Tax=Bacillus sp. JJ1562 TaxID=3122960 RepID=UPI003001FBC3
MFKKLGFLVIIFTVALTTAFNVNEVGANNNLVESEKTLFDLEYTGNGSFKINNNKKGFGLNSKENAQSYKVKKKDNGVFEFVENNDLPFDLVIQSTEDQFQAVGEKEIDVNNYDEILNDERISDYIKEDILNFLETATEEEKNNVTLTVYSPDLIENPSNDDGMISIAAASYLPTVYYTGYGSMKYKDEVLYITGYSSNWGTKPMSSKAAAQAEYSKLWSHTMGVLVGEGISAATVNFPLVGPAVSFISFFGQDPAIGGSAQDKINVRTGNERKYRKYTSIMFPKSDYKLGATVDHAYFDIHYEKIVSGKTTRQDIYNVRYTAPNYYSADRRAFDSKGSIAPWRETYSQFKLYGLTFASGIR